MTKLIENLQLYTTTITLKALPGQSYEDAEWFAKGVALVLPNTEVLLEFNGELYTIQSEK